MTSTTSSEASKSRTAQVVLIHGAWFAAKLWEPVIAELAALGASAVAVELPLAGFAADVAAARRAIEAAGPGAVVAAHSYGGNVVSAAASGNLSIARLVYVAAFLSEPDEHPSSILAAHRSELLDAIRITETGVDVDSAKARHLFFGDADDETGAEFVARLRSMPLTAGDMDYEGEPAWKSLPCTYLVATRDRAIPPDAQRFMATRADEVIEWPTDHSPFTSHPRRMAELLHSYIP